MYAIGIDDDNNNGNNKTEEVGVEKQVAGKVRTCGVAAEGVGALTRGCRAITFYQFGVGESGA